MTKRDGYMIYR